MKKVTIALCALVAVVFLALPASAEMGLDVGAKLGFSVPMGDWGDYFDSAFAFGAYAEYEVMANLAVEASFLHHKHGSEEIKEAVDWYTGAGVDLDVPINELTVNAKYYFPLGLVKPFVTAGLGIYLWEVEAAAFGFSTSSESFTDVGFNVGGGASYAVTDQVSAGAELRYNIVAGDFDDSYLNILGLVSYGF